MQASTRPNFAVVAASADAIEASLDTSHSKPAARTPCSARRPHASRFRSARRLQTAISPPARAQPSAIPSPMPELPPVTTTTRPVRSEPIVCLTSPRRVDARVQAHEEATPPDRRRRSAWGLAVLSPLRAVDQARAAAIGEIGPRPLEHHEEPVLEAYQEVDVDREPEHPGREAAEAETADVADRAAAPDRGHLAAVAIDEGNARPAGELVADLARHVAALLHRYGREARKRRTAGARGVRLVAEREDLGMVSEREVGPDQDAAVAVGLDAESLPERRRPDARGPERGGHLDPLPRSEEHTSELQSLRHLVCRLLLEKKKMSSS